MEAAPPVNPIDSLAAAPKPPVRGTMRSDSEFLSGAGRAEPGLGRVARAAGDFCRYLPQQTRPDTPVPWSG